MDIRSRQQPSAVFIDAAQRVPPIRIAESLVSDRSGSADGDSASNGSVSGVPPSASSVESTVAPEDEDFASLAEVR